VAESSPVMEEPVFSPQMKPRLAYLDTLKVLLTVLVIIHHAGQPYGPGGWWYYAGSARSPWLGILFYINETSFMCLFFFISAYFMPGSYDRKGPGAYLLDRVVRLGVPLAAFALLIQPLQTYVSYTHFRGGTLPLTTYYTQVYLGFGATPANWPGPVWPDFQFGHLWFLEHLLIYALLYTVWRLVWRPRARAGKPADRRPLPPPSSRAIAGLVLGLGAICLVVRLWYPVQWEVILGFIQAQRGRLPQYIAWVVLGTLAYRNDWLTTLPKRVGMAWLWTAGGAIAVAIATQVLGIRFGLVLQPVVDAVWENLIGVGLIVGLLTIYRERRSTPSRLARALAPNAYGAYIFHVPVVVLLQYGLAAAPFHPLLKFLLVCLVGVPASFLVGAVVRRLPGARSVL
jgi:glucans biosynthesis protein C